MAEPGSKAWLKPFIKPLMPTFREVIFMSAFINLVALATPVFSMQVFDRVVFHAGISTLWGLVIGMICVIIFDIILKLARSRVMQSVALKVDVLVGRKLFDKLMALPLAELESRPAGHWQGLFRDVDVVRNTLSGGSAVLLCDLPFVVLFLFLILAIAPPVAPVLLIILPLFLFVAWKAGNVMAEANQEERQSSISRDQLIAEMIQGRTTIKALALDQAMRPHWEQSHADNIEKSMVRGAKTDFYSNLGGSLTMSTTLLMTTVGALAIVNQEMTMGSLIAANMLSGRLLGPLNQLVNQWRSFNSFKQAAERLGDTFNTTSERQEAEVVLDSPKGELRTENVSFSYTEGTKPILNNVSITLPAGGIHALVGRNGSGKTTLLKMLQGLYRPTSGRVLLDGADIAQFTRSELADWMGYVPQECVLFAGTLRSNIAHRHAEATDEEVIRAATHAGVHHFIIDLPDGYASDIGEAGSRLSGGQRQRIAIARALLGDPSVLMMDEPSASLDRQAEQALRETLREIAKTRSVILVTHSPILLAACDDLVALDQGRVALAGPSEEILPRLFGQQPMAKPADDKPKGDENKDAKPVGNAHTGKPTGGTPGNGEAKAAENAPQSPAVSAAGKPQPPAAAPPAKPSPQAPPNNAGPGPSNAAKPPQTPGKKPAMPDMAKLAAAAKQAAGGKAPTKPSGAQAPKSPTPGATATDTGKPEAVGANEALKVEPEPPKRPSQASPPAPGAASAQAKPATATETTDATPLVLTERIPGPAAGAEDTREPLVLTGGTPASSAATKPASSPPASNAKPKPPAPTAPSRPQTDGQTKVQPTQAQSAPASAIEPPPPQARTAATKKPSASSNDPYADILNAMEQERS